MSRESPDRHARHCTLLLLLLLVLLLALLHYADLPHPGDGDEEDGGKDGDDDSYVSCDDGGDDSAALSPVKVPLDTGHPDWLLGRLGGQLLPRLSLGGGRD